MPIQTEQPLVSEAYARSILPDAVGAAFGTLALEGYRQKDLHRVAVCAELADITVGNITRLHVSGAEHETHIGEDLTTHDYPVVRTTGGDIVADGTWQQFLPPNRRSSHLPEVLIGTREEVAKAARNYGVPEEKISLWQIGTKRDLEKTRLADAAADAASDRADRLGRWDAFIGSDRDRNLSGRAKHRRQRGSFFSRSRIQ
ncbi:MAG TPA: hypothetical protein VGS08_01825 [Candidatus Saccharimonadales bacterium]|nr:hypothetical protein [Candidatus Saccharimonadales bacterium]